MNRQPPPQQCPPEPLKADSAAVCSECGAFGAFDFGDFKLCPTCYSEKGSCCPEFGKDDLWQGREDL